MTSRSLLLPVLLSCLAGTVGAQASILGDDDVRSFRIRLGVTDDAERVWDGTVTVSTGELLGVREWRPRPENEVVQDNEWRARTTQGVNFRWRAWEETPNRGVRPYFWTPGFIVDIRTQAGTRLDVRTAQGRFSFHVNDISPSESRAFLDGAAVVDEVPRVEKLTGDDLEDDFVTMLDGANGEAWVAWVGFRDGANQIYLRRFDGSGWEPRRQVAQNPEDIFLVKLGRDSDGGVWAVWSQQTDGNFDLYARRLQGDEWGAIERLTRAPQPDIFHDTVTDADGRLWIVWQGFREGRSDIFARYRDGDGWSRAFQVSATAGDDWEPVIAADSQGNVTVVWDTYDTGDYNIRMRSFVNGEWRTPEPVADTKLYEAHASAVYDAQDRLWIAYNEAGMNWGKDTGYPLNVEGQRLYESRLLRVVVWNGSEWREPATDVNAALPEDYEPRYDDFPKLRLDHDGRVWLFARQRIQRRRDTHSETPLHRAAWEIWGSTLDGDRWLEPLHFPFSQSRQDVRWDLASDGKGRLFAAWQTDHRDFAEFLYERADVYVGRLPRIEGRTAAPRLRPRIDPELFFYDMAVTEPEDLERIRGYVIDSGGKQYKIYRGDTHRHTEFSMDGNNDGSLFQTYRYALDAAELDYLLVSEHNGSAGPDRPYISWLLQQAADVFGIDNRFLPFYGYERSISYPDGHRNILFAERGKPTLPITPAEAQHREGAGRLYAYLKRYNGIAISHTSATGMGTDWRDNDPEVEPLVEIFQGDRVSAEYEGAPLAAHSENMNSAPGGFRPAGYVWNAWAKGYKLGIQAASDHLSTHISYACTIAEEFTREGLLDAMKQRHSYGATDNIVLDYRLQTDSGEEYLQGDILSVDGGFRLWVRVLGTTPIRQIDIIKNQQFLHNRQKLPQETEFTFIDNQKAAGEDLYYVRVIQENDAVAWSSPIWVTTTAAED